MERIERYLAIEIFSFISIAGFAVGLLEFHRFIISRIMFSLGCMVLALRFFFWVRKRGKFPWIGFCICICAMAGLQLYLLNIVNDAQEERQGENLGKLQQKFDEVKRRASERPKTATNSASITEDISSRNNPKVTAKVGHAKPNETVVPSKPLPTIIMGGYGTLASRCTEMANQLQIFIDDRQAREKTLSRASYNNEHETWLIGNGITFRRENLPRAIALRDELARAYFSNDRLNDDLKSIQDGWERANKFPSMNPALTIGLPLSQIKEIRDCFKKLAAEIPTEVVSPAKVGAAKPYNEDADLAMRTGPSTDPKYAFETRFILTNRGPLDLSDTNYICELPKIDSRNTPMTLNQPVMITPAASGPVGSLAAGREHSIYCDFTAAGLFVGQLDQPFVKIWIFYTYNNKTGRKQSFQFLALRKADRTFEWVPRGAAEETKP